MEVVNALDSYGKNKNIGENGHAQHSWESSNVEEHIIKLYFQIVRCNDKDKLEHLSKKYGELITLAKATSTYFLNILLRILFHTRDIINGKGEYTLFYHLLYEWNELYDNDPHIRIAIRKGIQRNFINVNDEHPFGSWKDTKYILNFYKDRKQDLNRGIPLFITQLTIQQLNIDYETYLKNIAGDASSRVEGNSQLNISLVSKWLPRECSPKFGYLAKHFVKHLYNNGNIFTNTQQQYNCMKKYRLMLSKLNRVLNTVQILQCDGRWREIDFEKNVTSITMNRQRHAFSNKGKNKSRHLELDRIECERNYRQYLDDCKSGKARVKAKRISLGSMVKEAYKHITAPDNDMMDALNLEWKAQNSNKYKIDNAIVMLDTSASMTWENCPFYDAMGLAIRIAENSSLGKRIMTFSSSPSWINLEGKETLTEMVKTINERAMDYGMNTNIYSALSMIANACVEKDLHPDIVKELTLYILSDMQIDNIDSTWNTLDDRIKELFKTAGMKTSHNTPYEAPIIVYWNMRSTQGFPCATNEKRIAMISGYSTSAIHSIVEKGKDALKEMTPWTNIVKSLEHQRYSDISI
jgi:hypothetical protein